MEPKRVSFDQADLIEDILAPSETLSNTDSQNTPTSDRELPLELGLGGGLECRISQMVSDLTRKGMYHVTKKLDKLIDIKLGAFGKSHVQRQECFEARIAAKVSEVRAALKDLQRKGYNDTFLTAAETSPERRQKNSTAMSSKMASSPKKTGTKVVKLDLNKHEKMRNSCQTTADGICTDNAANQLFESINMMPCDEVVYNTYDINEGFITQLEQESERLVQSMVMSDRLVESIVQLDSQSKSPTKRGSSLGRSSINRNIEL